jgi:hypothetical protein
MDSILPGTPALFMLWGGGGIISSKYVNFQFITYLLLYPVDITHNINFNYYTVYFYATYNVKNVTWRSLLAGVDCDVTNFNFTIRTTSADSGMLHLDEIGRGDPNAILRGFFTKLMLRDFILYI